MTDIHRSVRTAMPAIGAAARFLAVVVIWGAALTAQSHEERARLSADTAQPQRTLAERDGQHDFDFEIGVWRTNLKRLVSPLSGSSAWVDYAGTTVVRKVWGGRANLVELVADGPAGRFEGLSLRLYNPESRQWSLNFASVKGGVLTTPAIGEFKNGRGEFYSQELFGGRAILVRFVISDITPDSCRFEQAFSADGGRTWEVNWVATDTRMKDVPGDVESSVFLGGWGGQFLAREQGGEVRVPPGRTDLRH